MSLKYIDDPRLNIITLVKNHMYYVMTVTKAITRGKGIHYYSNFTFESRTQNNYRNLCTAPIMVWSAGNEGFVALRRVQVNDFKTTRGMPCTHAYEIWDSAMIIKTIKIIWYDWVVVLSIASIRECQTTYNDDSP